MRRSYKFLGGSVRVGGRFLLEHRVSLGQRRCSPRGIATQATAVAHKVPHPSSGQRAAHQVRHRRPVQHLNNNNNNNNADKGGANNNNNNNNGGTGANNNNNNNNGGTGANNNNNNNNGGTGANNNNIHESGLCLRHPMRLPAGNGCSVRIIPPRVIIQTSFKRVTNEPVLDTVILPFNLPQKQC